MIELVLLVVAAAWLAVLIPPLLRSRVENRPNSSVTDFRRQLTRLQNTATPPRGAVRAIGRPLAQSPLSHPVAGGRPGQPQLRSGLTRHSTPSELAAQANAAPVLDEIDAGPRVRSHGDPTGGRRRPPQRNQQREQQRQPQTRDRHERSYEGGISGGQFRSSERRNEPRDGDTRHDQMAAPTEAATGRRAHGDASAAQRRPSNATGEIRSPAKQRRMNVMFVLVLTTACTLFLAVSTGAQVMFYVFVLSFLSLVGYIWMLAQARQRQGAITPRPSSGWMDS